MTKGRDVCCRSLAISAVKACIRLHLAIHAATLPIASRLVLTMLWPGCNQPEYQLNAAVASQQIKAHHPEMSMSAVSSQQINVHHTEVSIAAVSSQQITMHSTHRIIIQEIIIALHLSGASQLPTEAQHDPSHMRYAMSCFYVSTFPCLVTLA